MQYITPYFRYPEVYLTREMLQYGTSYLLACLEEAYENKLKEYPTNYNVLVEIQAYILACKKSAWVDYIPTEQFPDVDSLLDFFGVKTKPKTRFEVKQSCLTILDELENE